MKPFSIAVEGNIFSGKSTVLEFLRNKGVRICPEQSPRQNFDGVDLSIHFPTLRSFAYVVHALSNSVSNFYRLMNENPNGFVATERSVDSIFSVNVDYFSSESVINCMERAILNDVYKILNIPYYKPELIVYIRVNPENICNRLKLRGCHSDYISYEKVKKVQELYDCWISYQYKSGIKIFEISNNDYNESLFERLEIIFPQVS